MAQLIVRNLEKSVVLKLKLRAAKNGVSTEEEVRRILRGTFSKKTKRKSKAPLKKSFLDFICSLPDFGDPDKLRQKDLPREINFD